MEQKWLEWAKQLQSIAQAGLTYSKDVYDIERFEAIRNISIEIMGFQTDIEHTKLKNLFASEDGYATPKVDIRAVVFHKGKILLVHENTDGWALPGGWGDIGLTPSEVAVKEVKEESGFDVQPSKLLAVLDKKCHPHPPSAYHVYKMFIRCELIGGKAASGIETQDVRFFSEAELPPLSIARNTESQLRMAFSHLHDPQKETIFD
ncbi:MAG: NUDIX hydrolase [Bacillus sp. (in: firmicutes)]